MRKTDKKIDNALRATLTEVCEFALERFDGFQWLTHLANYRDFPASLVIVCVFDTGANLSAFMGRHEDEHFIRLIAQHLAAIDIHLKDARRHVSFDTEEDCARSHNGQWAERLRRVAPGRLH